MVRVLLVERVRLVCDVVGAVLQSEPDIEIVGIATTLEDAVRALGKTPCDVALIGTSLPDEGALSLVNEIVDGHLGVKALVVGVPNAEPVIMTYLSAGGAGYILQDDPIQELLANVRAANDDEALVTPAVAARLIARVADLSERLSHMGVETSYYQTLTPREREILQLIGEGMTNQQIAQKLIIEVGTVKNHVHSILDKLNVNSRKDAALYLSVLGDIGNGTHVESSPA